MWQLGENDWIKYGWGKNLSSTWSPGECLYIDLSNYSVSDLPIAECAKIAVENIEKTYPGPYTLMCSGGQDSQAMISCWLQANVPFNIVSIRYISEGIFFNEHDLKTLETFAKNQNLTVEYKDFDVINFLENELDFYANEYDCSSPQICTHMKMSELIESGTVLFSGNYISKPEINNGNIYGNGWAVNYTLFGMHRYSLKISTKNKTIIPFFLAHNSNLAFSFPAPDNTTPAISVTVTYIINKYHRSDFPIILPPLKYTGFEELKNYYDKYYSRVNTITRLTFAHKPSKRIFDLLFRYPYEKAGKWCKTHLHLQQFIF